MDRRRRYRNTQGRNSARRVAAATTSVRAFGQRQSWSSIVRLQLLAGNNPVIHVGQVIVLAPASIAATARLRVGIGW